jgi:hypothetical protein
MSESCDHVMVGMNATVAAMLSGSVVVASTHRTADPVVGSLGDVGLSSHYMRFNVEALMLRRARVLGEHIPRPMTIVSRADRCLGVVDRALFTDVCSKRSR